MYLDFCGLNGLKPSCFDSLKKFKSVLDATHKKEKRFVLCVNFDVVASFVSAHWEKCLMGALLSNEYVDICWYQDMSELVGSCCDLLKRLKTNARGEILIEMNDKELAFKIYSEFLILTLDNI